MRVKFYLRKNIILFILVFLSYGGTKLPKCNESDTIFQKGDTLVYELYCYDDNKPRILLPYKNGKLHGEQMGWHPNGLIASRVSYFEGQYDGVRIGFNEKGDTSLYAEYKKGKLIGIYKEWYPNGRLQAVIRYDSLGRKHGLSERWREDGTRRDSIVYDHDEFVEVKTYFINGKVRYWSWYKNGKLDVSKSWSPEGKELGVIRNGNGIQIYYTEDGKSRCVSEYKDGEEISWRELKEGEDVEEIKRKSQK